jgi:hypothetical protein
MNKVRTFFAEQPVSLLGLGVLLLLIALIGLGLSIAVLVSSSLQENLFSFQFCLQKQCVKDYLEAIDQALVIAKATFDLCVAIATVGGIFVALLSYFNSAGTAALANHIEHLKVFCEYLDSEIKKRDRISGELIDYLLLYGFIFNQSRSGKTSVSDEYKILINGLNKIIENSNAMCKKGASMGFDYRRHQEKIRDHLAPVGITLFIAPRNDYFETEGQLFSLLHRLGQSFCAPGSVPEIISRDYH